MSKAHVIHAGAGGDRIFGDLALLLPHIHFHLFEPHRTQMAELRKRYSGRCNMTLYEAALVGPFTSSRDFYMAKAANGSTLFKEKTNLDGAVQTRVACVGVNDAIARCGEGNVALSLACNGAEFEIIPELLESAVDLGRIQLWRVAWGHQRIPIFANLQKELGGTFKERGIHNCTEAEFCVALCTWWRREFFE